MNVTVHLGEPFWRTINTRAVELSLSDEASVADALDALVERHPALAPDLRGNEAQPALFLDDDETRLDSRLMDGSTLHIVWPVSGG